MSLSQVQIIRSLGEALGWFEKELAWAVEPAELRHLTGRIGELYAAMITRGQMALGTNQPGYDVIGADGERISVKTVTSSTHVTFRRSTFAQVDRVMILKVNVDEGEASIEEVFDGSAAELTAQCTPGTSDLVYTLGRGAARVRPLDEQKVLERAAYGEHTVIQYENGTVVVETAGVREAAALPVLKRIAAAIGVSLLNGNGNPRNTRQLGAQVIAALDVGQGMTPEERRAATANRFAWGPGDVVMKDADGNVITARRALELQLEQRRMEVEEDVPLAGEKPEDEGQGRSNG